VKTVRAPLAPPPPSRQLLLKALWLIVCISIAASLALALQSHIPREAAWMAGIFVLAALFWMTELLPLFATSLLVMALQILLLANPAGWEGFGFEAADAPHYSEFLHAAADPVLLLFFGGFILARAAVKHGVDVVLSAILLRPFLGSPRRMLLGLIAVTALFSMWMSNTATTAMMMMMVTPLLSQLQPNDRFRIALALAVPFAANIGGIGTPIGTPPNAIAVAYLAGMGHPMTFVQWMVVAVPLMALLLVILWLLLSLLYKPQAKQSPLTLRSGKVSAAGNAVLLVFLATVGLWMTDFWHGLPTSVVALLPAVLLTAGGLLDQRDLNSLEWNVLVLIGGGLALGFGLQATELDRLVVERLPLASLSFGLVLVLMLGATALLGTFMSHTAATNLLLPIGVSAALLVGADQIGVLEMTIGIALGSSMAMALPISTPPNAIAYASGAISTRQMMLAGTILGLLGLGLLLSLFRLLISLALGT
ncbi:MAG: SLC13 family permease, partial [Verrucomicrobiales bacterium]